MRRLVVDASAAALVTADRRLASAVRSQLDLAVIG